MVTGENFPLGRNSKKLRKLNVHPLPRYYSRESPCGHRPFVHRYEGPIAHPIKTFFYQFF